jgi:hypothetical protein
LDRANRPRFARSRGSLSDRPELRSVIETSGVGGVDVTVVSAMPAGVVRTVSAVAEINRISPYVSERLKGVAAMPRCARPLPDRCGSSADCARSAPGISATPSSIIDPH